MFSRINIEDRLRELRNKRIDESGIMEEVSRIFSENTQKRQEIITTLRQKTAEKENCFDFDLLESTRIFHEDDIKNICKVYRLRFLDSHYFKGDFPEEAISEIRHLEKIHETELDSFKIVAPAKLMKLENADDPLLFAPMGNDYYYLIHKWGKDLHPLRRIMMWPFRSMDNLCVVVILLSILITMLAPMHWFTQNPGVGNYIFLFMIVLNGVGGLVLFYGIKMGKNFNGEIWNSKYYNG